MGDSFPCSDTKENNAIPEGSNLDGKTSQELRELKMDNDAWHPDLWAIDPEEHIHEPGLIDFALLSHQQSRSGRLETQLASYFTSLKNPDCLTYFYEDEAVPGRYHKVSRREDELWTGLALWMDYPHRYLNAHIGLLSS